MSRLEAKLKYPAREQATAFSPEESIPFRCAVVGTTFPVKNYTIPREGLARTLKVSYVVDGDGEVLLDGVWKPVCAGDIFLLTPKTCHNYRSHSETPFHTFWISYYADYIGDYLTACGVAAGIYHLPVLQNNFEQLFKFAEQAAPSPYTYFEIMERVHEIIHMIGMTLLANEADDAENIRKRLCSMIYQKADLDRVAKELHMSKSSVIRIYKKRFGITPHQYLLSLKIDNAKLLLRATNASVREIAERLCICDEHYFSTVFRKHAGVSPSTYRKTH